MDFRRVKEKYQFIVEGRDIVAVFIIVTILLGLSFGMGVITGQYISTRTHQKAKATSPTRGSVSSFAQPVVTPPPVAAAPPAGVGKEHFAEKTTAPPQAHPPVKTKEPVGKPRETPVEKKVRKTQPPVKTEKKQKAVQPQKKKSEEEKLATTLPPVEKKLSSPKSRRHVRSTAKKFTVQVASYRSRQDAIATVQKLKKMNYDAYLMTANLGAKGIWYRVRVGYFYTKDEAMQVLRKLSRYGFKPIIAEVEK